jgi:hypothetical protein
VGPALGETDGSDVGALEDEDGSADGSQEGTAKGFPDGLQLVLLARGTVGCPLRRLDGNIKGCPLEDPVGSAVCNPVGNLLGSQVDNPDGAKDGNDVGDSVGIPLCSKVSNPDGTVLVLNDGHVGGVAGFAVRVEVVVGTKVDVAVCLFVGDLMGPAEFLQVYNERPGDGEGLHPAYSKAE